MYKKLIPLDPQAQQGKSLHPAEDYFFAARQMWIELAHSELSKALTALPLAFVVNNEEVLLVAVMALQADKNNFVSADGRWLTSYIPSRLRAWPYALVDHPQAAGKQLLCLEEKAIVPADEQHPALFNEDGSPGEELQKAIEFWQTLHQDTLTTRTVAKTLHTAGLLAPWELKVEIEGQETTINGFWRIEEERLKALSAEQLLTLRDNGALGLAYAQMFANEQMHKLQQATSYHVNHNAKQRELEAQLDAITHGDSLSFGF
ncbi:MAG: SapC family protein [Desulfuromonadaceae bacterium]|jgi:hypothetical protein|nr:SapC family protein [Desulfuromonadaceae bacterium]